MSFSNLGLAPCLCRPLAGLGYAHPTPIQTHAIPAVLTGTDLLARAQTGTGKTAAFELPMIERLVVRRDGAGIKTAVIHGNKTRRARTRALGDFKAGRVAVPVATDIAARGLDIAQLPLVINHHLPLAADDYIHRVGRTGRAGRAGRAVSLGSAAESRRLRDIQRLVPAPFEQVAVHGCGATNAEPSTHQPGRRRDRWPRAGGDRSHGIAPRKAGHSHGQHTRAVVCR